MEFFLGYVIVLISTAISALLNGLVFHYVYKFVYAKKHCYNFKSKGLWISFFAEVSTVIITSIYCALRKKVWFSHPILLAYRLVIPSETTGWIDLGITMVSSISWIIIYPLLMSLFVFSYQEKSIKLSTKAKIILLTSVTNAPYSIILSLSANIVAIMIFLICT